MQIDRGRNRSSQLWQNGKYAIDGVDDVGRRLFISRNDDRRLPVVESVIASVLHRIDDVAQVSQAHRRAIVIAHAQRRVLWGMKELSGRVDLPPGFVVRQRALRLVSVGILERGRNVRQAEIKSVENGRVDLDPQS